MVEQYYNIIGKNKFQFRIISNSSYWSFVGYEVVVNNDDVYVLTPTTGKDSGYLTDRETFYMNLFEFHTKPSHEELNKINLTEIRVAANVNPSFLRNLLNQLLKPLLLRETNQ